MGFLVQCCNSASSVLTACIEFASEELVRARLALAFIQICQPPTGTGWFFRAIALSVGRNQKVAISGRAVGTLKGLFCVRVQDLVGIVPQHLRVNRTTAPIYVDFLNPGGVILRCL